MAHDGTALPGWGHSGIPHQQGAIIQKTVLSIVLVTASDIKNSKAAVHVLGSNPRCPLWAAERGFAKVVHEDGTPPPCSVLSQGMAHPRRACQACQQRLVLLGSVFAEKYPSRIPPVCCCRGRGPLPRKPRRGRFPRQRTPWRGWGSCRPQNPGHPGGRLRP